ncbi:MAG: alkaline phosphatase PafA [Flavobacteriales bacterium]
MIKSRLFFSLLIASVLASIPETKAQQKTEPKLVVAVVVDQMRYDYIQRFWDDFGANGFKKLVEKGYFFRNTHFSYSPTYTGPGHATIFTGTTPRYHGIIANDWYDRERQTYQYCSADADVNGLETGDRSVGKMSPKNLLVSTVADELKLYTQQKGKSFGVSIKDRGAILPVGATADAAYWFDGLSGRFISSDYYQSSYPNWVSKFNTSGRAEALLSTPWKPLRAYPELFTGDENQYEEPYSGEEKASFPHHLDQIHKTSGSFDVLKASPFGNTILCDFAIELIEKEALGLDDYPDFLSVSFSSTDYVGHQFGTQSWETKDTYLRLDSELEKLIEKLDNQIGKSNYILVLTADHGAGINLNLAKDLKLPAGSFSSSTLLKNLNTHLETKFQNPKTIANISNQQVFYNKAVLDQFSRAELDEACIEFIRNQKGIAQVVSRLTLETAQSSEYTMTMLTNGFCPSRSGDLAYVLHPGWMQYGLLGTTHGSTYFYDTHVPLIWYGSDIQHGESFEKVNVKDIAPSISSLFYISAPNGATGNVLTIPQK